METRARRTRNAVLLSLLALPCLLVFQSDAGMWPLNLLGVTYTYGFIKSLTKDERFSNYMDDTSDKMN